MLGRIDPYTMTDSIKAKLLHKSRALHFLTIPVIEFMTLGFIFCDPPKVSTQPELLLFVFFATSDQ